MDHIAPRLNINSPEVKRIAEELGLTVTEFVEYSILHMMEAYRTFPETWKGRGREHMEALLITRDTIHLLHKLPYEEQVRIISSDSLYQTLNITPNRSEND